MPTLPCLAQATSLSLCPHFSITFSFEGLWGLLCIHRLNLCLPASGSPKIFAYLALTSHVSETEEPCATNTVASRLYIAPSLLAPRGTRDGWIDGAAEQLLHVSSLDTGQPHAGRQTCAELTAGWAPLAGALILILPKSANIEGFGVSRCRVTARQYLIATAEQQC